METVTRQYVFGVKAGIVLHVTGKNTRGFPESLFSRQVSVGLDVRTAHRKCLSGLTLLAQGGYGSSDMLKALIRRGKVGIDRMKNKCKPIRTGSRPSDVEDMLPSRRNALGMLTAVAMSFVPFQGDAELAGPPSHLPPPSAIPAPGPARNARKKPYLSLVSRHIQWTDAETGIAVAKQAGFPAILWTVRPGAHIDPAQVETELTRVVKLTRAAGMETPMIITAINDVGSDRADAILGTMQSLGIRLYRSATQRYDLNSPIQAQFDSCRRKIASLAKLNAKYGTTAAFHTHSYAESIGGSGWDLVMMVQGEDPRYVGLNYDIGHVTAKGGDGWKESIRAAGPYLHSVSIKDFLWEKDASVPPGQWPWRTRFVRPGDGMVNFPECFRYLQQIGFQGPCENYFEYMVDVPGRPQPFDMLGTDYLKWKLEMPQDVFVDFLKRDVNFYNKVWEQVLTTLPPPPYSTKAAPGRRREG